MPPGQQPPLHRHLRALLRAAGIRHALTSGMACVEYGLAQTTKDTDWIIHPEDLPAFRLLLASLEENRPASQVIYRSAFGVPLEHEWMACGWTSHLLLLDPHGEEHKLDIFSAPPRTADWSSDDNGLATRHTVASMKKTARAKDWPFVNSLAQQMESSHNLAAILHLDSPEALLAAWQPIPPDLRAAFALRRPLLRHLDTPGPLPFPQLLSAERLLWQALDAERGSIYHAEWKAFHHRARPWPVQDPALPFPLRHARLVEFCRHHALPPDPLGAIGHPALLARARARVIASYPFPEDALLAVQPPAAHSLP